jgi:Holliday junction resolvase RusA-like endonuclease
VTIILPIPHKHLSPNASRNLHWATKRNAVEKARGDAKIAATDMLNRLGYPLPPRWKRATCKMRFFFRTRARHDPDNTIGLTKAYRDGFTDAGVWEDDQFVTILPPELGHDKANPRVEIEVNEC